MCKFYAYDFEFPFKLQKKKFPNIHQKTVRTAHKEMIQRAHDKKVVTRNEILTLLKETDDENVNYTNAKLELYECYPRQPSDKDIKWLKAI